jgi:hypothetical protein
MTGVLWGQLKRLNRACTVRLEANILCRRTMLGDADCVAIGKPPCDNPHPPAPTART